MSSAELQDFHHLNRAERNRPKNHLLRTLEVKEAVEKNFCMFPAKILWLRSDLWNVYSMQLRS